MIVVIGEALVDVVTGADGREHRALGGAPYNTSRAIARLGGDVEYVGCLSDDETGEALVAGLAADGVGLRYVRRTSAPSTVVRARIGAGGGATYHFELAGTAAPALDTDDLAALPPRPDVVFTGGLALVADPSASAVAWYLEQLAAATIVVVDLNCRPAAIVDEQAYREIVRRVCARADIVKVSDEDLAVLHPSEELDRVVGRLAADGAVVIVTAGPDGSTLVTPARSTKVEAAPLPGPVVDTIGAGDTFDGAFVEWLAREGVTRSTLGDHDLAPGLRVAARAASIVVTRRGADPPTRADL